METQLNVFKASSRSRSPVDKREAREEEKRKDPTEESKREEDSDQRKDLLNLLEEVTKEEEEKEGLIGESKVIDPSPGGRAPTSFSDIGRRTKRPKDMREEEAFKVIKSAAELEHIPFKHLDLSRVSAEFAATTRKPVSPPTRMELSPQKRREKHQRLIDGNWILRA